MAYGQLFENHISKNFAERGQVGSALTGTVAPALAADGVIWTYRYPETAVAPNEGPHARRLYIQRLHLHFVTLTAFTTPVTASRHLKLVRADGPQGTANPSGGAEWVPVRKRSVGVRQEILGVGRVATTGALTTTGFTLETNVINRLLLAGVGASGAQYDEAWRYDGVEADPLYLLPGEAIMIAAGATMDAAGTFQLDVSVDACEVP